MSPARSVATKRSRDGPGARSSTRTTSSRTNRKCLLRSKRGRAKRDALTHACCAPLHSAKSTELKVLDRAPRRPVCLGVVVGQFEPKAKHLREASGVVALHRQAATFFRAIKCEGADDDLASGSD